VLKKAGIPIFFFHIDVGEFYYIGADRFTSLDIALRQATLASPNSDVILLTDKVRPLNFEVIQIPIASYTDNIADFEKSYIHISNNTQPYELTCFARWFIIRNFIRQHEIRRFCVLDSDIMLFSPIEVFAAEFSAPFRAGNWAWANFFSDVGALDLMCDYFSDVFANHKLLDELAEKINQRIGRRHISDMQLLFELPERSPVFLDQSGFPAKGFDNSVRKDDGVYLRFEHPHFMHTQFMLGSTKYLTIGQDGVPLARRNKDGADIPFHLLHFQGPAKWLMSKFAWTGPQGKNKPLSSYPITISRNELCPCGSGARVKYCHGRFREGHSRLVQPGGLPRATTSQICELLEKLTSPPYIGAAELYRLASTLSLEVDDVFPIADALQILEFAEVKDNVIKVTAAGRVFVQGGTDERKRLFGVHLLRFVPLAAHIRRVLDDREDHRAPRTRFETDLEDHLPRRDAKRTLRIVTAWGRYAEIFAYNDRRRAFTGPAGP
jgi:hypothetical protein